MKRHLFLGLCATIVACKHPEKTVGMVLPVEHQALSEIQEGFISTLKKSHPGYKVITKNAMGDPNLMQSILRSFHTQKIAYVVPVGTGTTTMAQTICQGQTIVGLAAYGNLTREDMVQNNEKRKTSNTYVVHDEIGMKALSIFFTDIFPHINSITLIHAQDEKTAQEAKDFQNLMIQRNKNIQLLPIITTNDLLPVCQNIKGQAVLILKDHNVVSGLEVILKKTLELDIPLIACDESSVKKGATCAFGVIERETGVKGAELLGQIIDGENPPRVIDMEPMYIIAEHTPSEIRRVILAKAKAHKVHTVKS